MRVLLVSHTALSRTNNMGKTLLSYLSAFSPDEVAQFYIHSEIPTDDTVCVNYYRFTDIDALKTIVFPFHKGTVFGKDRIETDRNVARIDEGIVTSAYVLGSKRRAWSMNAREFIWKLSHWKKKRLKEWIDEFNPDVILFASGDYSFMYDIAYWIAVYCDKPLVTICVDDYYLNDRNGNTFLGRFHHKRFMKSVVRTIDRSSYILTLSDLMKKAYEKRFNKQCFTVHNSVPPKHVVLSDNRHKISYIGNLGFGRIDQLVEIGKTLSELNRVEEPTAIDVYTGTFDPSFKRILQEAKGIRLYGRISADEVLEVMQNSLAIIHTESFRKDMQDLVRYSVSTKIAESLMYGPCLFAYGPTGIASIDYLIDNDVAYVVTSPNDLKHGLEDIIEKKEMRQNKERNARSLAELNHDSNVIPQRIRELLSDLVRNRSMV